MVNSQWTKKNKVNGAERNLPLSSRKKYFSPSGVLTFFFGLLYVYFYIKLINCLEVGINKFAKKTKWSGNTFLLC